MWWKDVLKGRLSLLFEASVQQLSAPGLAESRRVAEPLLITWLK